MKTFANDNETSHGAAAKRVVARQFSTCGPCLLEGEVVRSTARFHVINEWKGGDDFTGRQRRISRESVHLTPCPSCRDHSRTQYPDGYMD